MFQFWTSVFKAVNNDQKFFIVNITIALCRYHAFVVKYHWVKTPLIVILEENLISNKIRDVYLQYNLTVEIAMSQYWSLCHNLFEILKCLDTVLSLCKWNLLSSKSNKRFDYFEEVLYELTVKVSEAYKALNLFEIDRFYSVYDCFDLLRIHTQIFIWHNDI